MSEICVQVRRPGSRPPDLGVGASQCERLACVNRLGALTSAYLLQHAENPVDWWPWCAEAFDEMRRRDISILKSIGYMSCHWCHGTCKGKRSRRGTKLKV